jgi:RNA polymerase sigma-70 factor (ECF subfamily)
MAGLQERLARGQQAAFAEFYNACADRVHHYLLVRLGTKEDADDAMQETFLRLARNRRKLAKVENLDAYVFAIARNEAAPLAAGRARRGRAQRPLGGEELFRASADDGAAREAAEIVAAALGQLSTELREVVELKTYAGLTFQQISQATGLPQGTVATRYRAALAKMNSWLENRI